MATITMNKELVTIEFRYHNNVTGNNLKCFNDNHTHTITIGVYDSLEDAIIAGNNALDKLSTKFEVRSDDKFKLNGLFGFPTRLVTNTCYPTNGVQYFAKITKLQFDDVSETIDEIFNEIN